MICSIHEDYGPAPNTFEIVEPNPPVPVEQFASFLRLQLKEYVEVTDIESASLCIPSEAGKTPKTIDRIMVNIDTSLMRGGTDFPQVIREAADTLFMASSELK